MLIQRIITATVLVAAVILALFQLPSFYFSLFLAVVTFGAAWEWLNLTSVDSIAKKLLFYVYLIVPMCGVIGWTMLLNLLSELMEWPEIKDYSDALEWLVIAPVLFWVLAMFLIRQTAPQLLQAEFKPRFKTFTGWLVLFSAWMFLSKLRAYYGPTMVLYFLMLIWAADILAYFTGKKWGKDKLAPEVSPGKTVQGMYGALVGAVLCAFGLRVYSGFADFQGEGIAPILTTLMSVDMLMLSVLTVLISIYGDLFFSLMKRKKGVKDSGSLLPGHGGILDRIDSIIAAAPFFYAGIVLIGRSVYS